MFDVGFWELCLVGLISLLVIGPERLPKAARIAGFWIGKTRNMVASVKEEIRQELREEELRQALKEQPELEDFKRLSEDLSNTVHNINPSVENFAESAEGRGKTGQQHDGE